MTKLSAFPSARNAMQIDCASKRDVAALRQLYFDIYGNNYPVALGTDPNAMATAVADDRIFWLVAREISSSNIIGSAVLRRDMAARIGKIEGVAVHPDHAGTGIARSLLSRLCEAAFGSPGGLDSVYATARCISPVPVRALLRCGLRPMGLLPGAAVLRVRENLALMVRHRVGILARRAVVDDVPSAVLPLLRAAREAAELPFDGALRPRPSRAGLRIVDPAPDVVEVVRAPAFVRRRHEGIYGVGTVMLPQTAPNVLLTPPDGRFEVYGTIDADAGCGALLNLRTTPGPASRTAHYDGLGLCLATVLDAMAEYGAGYIEKFVPLADLKRLEFYVSQGFVPSALYPAMRCDGTYWHDHVILTHTTGHPDFRALDVDRSFLPYMEQYRQSWTATFLNAPAKGLHR